MCSLHSSGILLSPLFIIKSVSLVEGDSDNVISHKMYVSLMEGDLNSVITHKIYVSLMERILSWPRKRECLPKRNKELSGLIYNTMKTGC